MDVGSLQSKVNDYKRILLNTKNYRKDWNESLKPMIINGLENISKETKLKAKIDVNDDIENLEVIIFSLGSDASGIAEKIPNSTSKRPFIKSHGSLVYQQLFNGKVMVLVVYPVIEGYGQPKPPKTLEILRPEEMKEPFLLRQVETFLKEIIDWEDYDDDVPKEMAVNPIGFIRPNGEEGIIQE